MSWEDAYITHLGVQIKIYSIKPTQLNSKQNHTSNGIVLNVISLVE